MKEKYVEAVASLLTAEAAKTGLLIEAGWAGYALSLSKGASQEQIDETKMAFFAGADHLYSSIMNTLDPGVEETADDMKKMEQIHNELGRFRERLKLRFAKTKGRA